jgi:hypothetical protein
MVMNTALSVGSFAVAVTVTVTGAEVSLTSNKRPLMVAVVPLARAVNIIVPLPALSSVSFLITVGPGDVFARNPANMIAPTSTASGAEK